MVELESIDPLRCQAEVKEGSFMTLGPRSYQRCQCIPIWIAVDIREGSFHGAMSLCDDCKKVCEIRMPSVSFQRLKV